MPHQNRLARGFVTNELQIAVAVLAVWIAVSLPIYSHGAKWLARHRPHAGPLEHGALILVALIVPPLLMGLLAGVGALVEAVEGRLSRERE